MGEFPTSATQSPHVRNEIVLFGHSVCGPITTQLTRVTGPNETVLEEDWKREGTQTSRQWSIIPEPTHSIKY